MSIPQNNACFNLGLSTSSTTRDSQTGFVINPTQEGLLDFFRKRRPAADVLEIINSNKSFGLSQANANKQCMSYKTMLKLLIGVNKACEELNKIYKSHSFINSLFKSFETASNVPTNGDSYVAQMSKILQTLSVLVTTERGYSYPIITSYNLKDVNTLGGTLSEFIDKSNLVKLKQGLESLVDVVEFSKSTKDNWAINNRHKLLIESDGDISLWFYSEKGNRELQSAMHGVISTKLMPNSFETYAHTARTLSIKATNEDFQHYEGLNAGAHAILAYCKGCVIQVQCYGIIKEIYKAISPTLNLIKVNTSNKSTEGTTMTTFNLGLEPIQSSIFKNWSYEQIYDLAGSLEKSLDGLINLITIRSSLRKYGRTPQLVDLVSGSFEAAGISVSVEGIMEAIGNLFKWIKEKLTALWNWFIGLFKSEPTADQTDKIVNEACSIIQEEHLEQEKTELKSNPKAIKDIITTVTELAQISKVVLDTSSDNVESISVIEDLSAKTKIYVDKLNAGIRELDNTPMKELYFDQARAEILTSQASVRKIEGLHKNVANKLSSLKRDLNTLENLVKNKKDEEDVSEAIEKIKTLKKQIEIATVTSTRTARAKKQLNKFIEKFAQRCRDYKKAIIYQGL